MAAIGDDQREAVVSTQHGRAAHRFEAVLDAVFIVSQRREVASGWRTLMRVINAASYDARHKTRVRQARGVR